MNAAMDGRGSDCDAGGCHRRRSSSSLIVVDDSSPPNSKTVELEVDE